MLQTTTSILFPYYAANLALVSGTTGAQAGRGCGALLSQTLTLSHKMLSRPSKQTQALPITRLDDDEDIDALVSFCLDQLGRPPPKSVHCTHYLTSHSIL